MSFRDADKPCLQADLGHARFLMLRNPGLLVVGPSIPEAFLPLYFFEANCRIQIDAQHGGELTQVDPQTIQGIVKPCACRTAAWVAPLRGPR